MVTSGKDTDMVCYNVQATVDAKNHLIVAREVTNIGNDRSQLSTMAKQAQTTMGARELIAIADRGYFKGVDPGPRSGGRDAACSKRILRVPTRTVYLRKSDAL
jgi:hypothetical protein